MSWISAICFGVNIFILLSCLKKGADPFSPARVFGFVWALFTGLTDLKFSRYQHTWSIESWLVFAVGIFSFLIGIFIIYSQNIHQKFLTLQQIRKKLTIEAKTRFDSRKFFWAIVLLFGAYLFCYVAETLIIGNLPIFSKNVEHARIVFGIFGFHLLVNANVAIMFLVLEFFLLIPGERYRKSNLLLVLFLTVVTFFLLLQRYNFFYCAVMCVPFVYFTSRHLKFRNILMGGGAFFGFLYLIRSLRVAQYVEQYHYVVSKMRYSPAYASFTEPYMYIVMNLENFARGVDKLDHYYMGFFTFDVAMALSGLKHWLEAYYSIDRLPFLVSGYNTYIFQWWYYYDFGVLGVAFFPFIVGMMTAYFYYQLRVEPTVLRAILYSIFFMAMLIGFISNPFTRLESVFNFSLILLINKYMLKPNKRVKENTIWF